MKKLNRKGFTLVELLAVIIILAIVVGITIPAVLTTTTKAKKTAFQTAADTTADWIDRQYQVYTTGLDASGLATLDIYFENLCTTSTSLCTKTGGITFTKGKTTKVGNTTYNHNDLLIAAGLQAADIATMNVYINSSTGRSCVTLVADAAGDYAGSGNSKTKVTNDTIKSSNC